MDVKRDAQEIYARWLRVGSWLAFGFALLALALYVAGTPGAFVPLEELPRLWSLPVEQFRARTGVPSGWAWLADLGYSDYLGLAAICAFALLSLLCYARVLPAFLARGERVQAALALAQIVVLLAAASHLIPGMR